MVRTLALTVLALSVMIPLNFSPIFADTISWSDLTFTELHDYVTDYSLSYSDFSNISFTATVPANINSNRRVGIEISGFDTISFSCTGNINFPSNKTYADFFYAYTSSNSDVVFSNLVNCYITNNKYLSTSQNAQDFSFDVTYEYTGVDTPYIRLYDSTFVSSSPFNLSAEFSISNLIIDGVPISAPTIPTNSYNFTLQNGWLSVIDLGTANASYNLDLTTQFAEYSHLSEPWWDSTQRYWYSSSLPEEDDTFNNDTQGTLISWNKTGKTDIFGRAKSAQANISGTSTARYLYIYNPAYHTFQGLTSVNDEANFPMNISGIAEGTDIYIYSTTEQYHLTTGPSTTIGNTTATTNATGSALDVTDTFENDGQYIAQNSGGGNDLNNSTGIVGYIMNINNVLDNFTNSIIQLLSAPISHIQQLVSAGTSFFSVFGQLFSTWLPTEVSSVIISALVVMIVIGVIKMLL